MSVVNERPRRTRLVEGPIVLDWSERAACRGSDPDVFYPSDGAKVVESRAKKVCARCPVRAECLEHALRTEEPYGVWGGLNEVERRAIRCRGVA